MMLYLVFYLLCTLLSLLLLPSTAFLEVGVSSYLENTVHHVSETNWTLVEPWIVTSRDGFFEATASGGKAFVDRFIAPESGIYFVALNLLMTNATTGFLKASLVINDEFKGTNGFEGVYGKTTFAETVSLSGFLRLYENDVIALYLHGSKGSLLRDSTFSVMQMSRIGTVPGFHAVLSHDQGIKPQIMTRLENWRASGSKGLFSMHSGTSPSVGLFCAVLQGIYQFSSNIHVQPYDQLTDCTFAIVLNSKTALVKRYSSGAKMYSTSISGMFHLNRGDCAELNIKTSSSVTVLLSSSFSGLFLGLKQETTQIFSAGLPAETGKGINLGWDTITNWTIDNSRRNFQSDGIFLRKNNSTFISDGNGLFQVTTLINFNSSSESSEHLLLAVNDPPSGLTGNNGLSAGKTSSASAGSLAVSGVVWLNKGDTLTVYFHSDARDSEVVDGLFCVSAIVYDWPGVAATLTESILLNTQEWTRLETWKTQGIPGLFSFDNAFSPTSGVYRPHQEGTYFFSCNVILRGAGTGNLSVVIAIDHVIDAGNGLYSLNENPKPVVTLNVAGSIRIKASQTVSVYVKATTSSSWNVSKETGFSAVFIGADFLTTPGFFAVKQKETRQSSSCGEIGKWSVVQPVVDPFFKNTAQFDSITGRFIAKEDGFYLATANILIRHSGSSRITMNIMLEGQSGETFGTSFQPKPSNSPSGDFVSTLTLVSAVRLVADQYVSIFLDVQCQSGLPWKVLPNSSFSVVLVSRWESDHAAGFVTKTLSEIGGLPSYSPLYYWSDPNMLFRNLNKPQHTPVIIKSSGLYFLQSVLIFDDPHGGHIFNSAVCIDGKPAFNGITAFKINEGNTGEFSISAFGTLYLRSKQKLELCATSETSTDFLQPPGSWFSMVRFLPLRQPPGFHQIFQDAGNTSVSCDSSVIRSMSTGGGQLAYINNNIFNTDRSTLPCNKGDFTPPLNGSYLISVMFTLRGNAPGNVTACVGKRKCSECYIDVYHTLKQYSHTFGFVGLVDLEKHELISMCLKSNDKTFSIVAATHSIQFLSGAELNRTVQLKHGSLGVSSSGWHQLVQWETRTGNSLQTLHVMETGLYFLSVNVQVEMDVEGLAGVKLEATRSNRDILSISSHTEADSTVSYSVAVVARLNVSEAIAVSVYSNSQYLNTRNATFYAALLTNDNQLPYFSLRSKPSSYRSGDWWTGIEHWEGVDIQRVSPHSELNKGIFVADVAGVYFLAAVVIVKTSNETHQTRLIELLLSVNGDTENTNGLKATKGVKDGLSVVLSLSATVYLEPWQSLYLMIKSTGVGTFEVINGSILSVTLLEEKKFYKTVASNITHFDNGPRVIRQPPPSVSLAEDLGFNVLWTCDAVANGSVTYSWLKNNQDITSSQDLSLMNVQVSDSGRYVCLAEYDNIKVFSNAAQLHVFDTTPQSQNRVFTAMENSNVSFELSFFALDKQRESANISLDIIRGNTNDTFVLSRTVSKDNFTLRNRILLDYEAIDLYVLTLIATNQDTNKTTTVNITVIISDVNDNPPIFTNRTFYVSVEENLANGTVIFQAKATDKDAGNNSIITYSLLNNECEKKIAIDASSGNVTVIGNLDRETNSEVTVCIQATDGKFRTITELVITVEDVNEFTPVFDPQHYERRVSETALVGETVIRVFAVDEDPGKESKIFYNITSGNVDETFSIDKEHGTIILQRPLDFETLKLYDLRVEASDGKFRSGTNVSIQVVDYNDNSPKFSLPSYSFSVPENISIGQLVGTINASDKDSLVNADIHYSISSNYDKFFINSSTGDIFTVNNLDSETTKNYVLLVMANDTGNPSKISTTMVTIIVTDLNDNPPEFVQQNFAVNISEASTLGTNIVCLSAIDRDSKQHAKISYSIVNGNVNDTFKVTSEGVVILQKHLDMESVQHYNLTIFAENSGAMVLRSRVPAIVIINIVDVNDNSPVFEQFMYSFSVAENATTNYFVGKVAATDRDSNENAQISYVIPSLRDREKFWINTSNGEIFTSDALDYDTVQNYNILVEAHDSGHPPRMAVTLVNITLTDVNDNSPEFVHSYFKVNISEASTIGTQIVCLSTTDRDSKNHAQTSIRISQGNANDTFNVTAEGVVILQRHLDYEKLSTYNLTFDAVNINSLKSNKPAVVIIHVEDINDNVPRFTSNSYSTMVLENVPTGHTVMSVTARDEDKGSNGQVTYSLQENPWATDNLASDMFRVNATNGAITTLKKFKLDAFQKEYQFQVKAKDNGVPSLESFAYVRVTVEDTNDSPPVFTVCPKIVQIEPPKTETEMFRVSTSDADHGPNANITYSIYDVKPAETSIKCVLESSGLGIHHNGSIYTTMELHMGCTYNLNISATDGEHFDFCYVVVRMIGNPDIQTQTGDLPDSWKIALIVIGIILFLMFIILVIVWIFRRRRQRSQAVTKPSEAATDRTFRSGSNREALHDNKSNGTKMEMSEM